MFRSRLATKITVLIVVVLIIGFGASTMWTIQREADLLVEQNKVAARRLTTGDFGVFALGTTLGWLASVVSDAGIQMHLAREVSRRPRQAWPLLRRWLRVRAIVASVVLVVVGGTAAVHAGSPVLLPLQISL